MAGFDGPESVDTSVVMAECWYPCFPTFKE
jgi:hypothetical protein